MLKARRALALAIASMLASFTATAQAQDPHGLGYAYLFGYGAANAPVVRSFVPAPPYFSLHPPVYYGQRYTRPYGDSPFASWPQLQSAKGYQPRPAASHAHVIVNPHAPAHHAPAQADSPVVQSVAPVRPLIVENPYYRSDKDARLVAKSPE